MKRFYYDLETTGLSYWKNGIHQIAGFIEIDGIIEETIDYRVKPVDGAVIVPEALKVGNVTEDDVMNYPHMGLVYTELISIMKKYIDKFNKKDKFHLVGYNNRQFDDPFLRAWFTQNHDKYFGSWFWSDSIDVMVLASDHLAKKRGLMENFKLMTVAKEMGIEVDDDKLHDGLYDIGLTRDIHKIIRNEKA